MVFSDTTDNTGLIQDCELRLFDGDYGAISSNTKRLQTFTNLINRALDKITALILKNDNTWQWEDYNKTDYPIGTTDIVSGQADYPLDVQYLTVREVQIKDEAGNRKRLIPWDERDLDLTDNTVAMEERYKEEGTPIYFNMEGNSIFLIPTPNYSFDDGLIVKTQRPHGYYVTTDTTKQPGIPSIYHYLVSYQACVDYAILEVHENAGSLYADLEKEKKSFGGFIAKRQLNRNNRLIPKYRSSK